MPRVGLAILRKIVRIRLSDKVEMSRVAEMGAER